MFDLSVYFDITRTVLYIFSHKCFTRYRSDPTLLRYQFCKSFGSVFPIYVLCKISLCCASGTMKIIFNSILLLKPLVISPINPGWYILRVILFMSHIVLHLTNYFIIPILLVTYYLLMYSNVSWFISDLQSVIKVNCGDNGTHFHNNL